MERSPDQVEQIQIGLIKGIKGKNIPIMADKPKIQHKHALIKNDYVLSPDDDKQYHIDNEQEKSDFNPTTKAQLEYYFKPYHKKEHEDPEWDFTLPGQHYIGPGTKVIHNILNNHLPNNTIDRLAMVHDLGYTFAQTPEDKIASDQIFLEGILNAKDTLPPEQVILASLSELGIGTKNIFKDTKTQYKHSRQQKLDNIIALVNKYQNEDNMDEEKY